MSKIMKRMMTAQFQAELGDATGLLIVDTGPMTVENAEALRADLREKAGGARLKIIHNRTARVAIRERWFEDGDDDLAPLLKGPTAVAFGGGGPIPIAKVLKDWRKKWKPLEVKGAVTDGELLPKEDLAGLAEMPDLPQLKAMMLGAILGTPRGIAVSLSAVYGGLARCIQARVDEGGGDAAAADDASPEPEAPAAATDEAPEA